MNVQIQGWVGGSAQIRMLFGCIKHYELLDAPIITCITHVLWILLIIRPCSVDSLGGGATDVPILGPME